MNHTLRTIHNLRTIHGDFFDREVRREDLQTILDAAVRAANSSARQPYSILVVEDKAVMKELLGYVGSKALVFCVDFNRLVAVAGHAGYAHYVNWLPTKWWPAAQSAPPPTKPMMELLTRSGFLV